MRVLVLIPARMKATRLPNKPLADIGGKPMVVRVYEQAMKAGVGDVYVAAGEQEIVDVVQAHGGQAVLTDPDLPSGSDRIWQATQRLMKDGLPKPDIILNAQGDEPLLPPELINDTVRIFGEHPQADVVTFAHPVSDEKDMADVAKVKAVKATNGRALYFSRSPIPHGAAQMLRHVGFYGYRYAALEKFVGEKPSPLEIQEKLEQLRGLEMGLYYHLAETSHEPIGVDTASDLIRVQQLFIQTSVSGR